MIENMLLLLSVTVFHRFEEEFSRDKADDIKIRVTLSASIFLSTAVLIPAMGVIQTNGSRRDQGG